MTTVAPVSRHTIVASKPQPWNAGADIRTVSEPRSGILETNPAGSDIDTAPSRGAPFGAPVLPLVRITSDDWC